MNLQLITHAFTISLCIVAIFATTNGAAQTPNPGTCANDSLVATTPSQDFEIVGVGDIVRHKSTGLEWQRCAIGQTWNGTTCQEAATTHTWEQALGIAASAGVDWRLPNIQELRSIVERCRGAPMINEQVFPGAPGSSINPPVFFWSSTPVNDLFLSGRVAIISFSFGITTSGGNTENLGIRLVRGGQ